MRSFLNSTFAVICLLLYAISSAILASLACILGAIAHLMPFKSWRRMMMRAAIMMPILWAASSKWILGMRRQQWDIVGEGELSPKKWYLLISNHQAWLDILVMGKIFSFKTPVLKFFMKKELLWTLPILGIASWLLGYPFMARHTRADIRKNPELKGKDIETTKKACQKFTDLPTTVMNFVEGTRFTPAKQERQKSPYKHLLKPKAAGVALVSNELRQQLSGIINVTIHYSQPMTLWKYLRGERCKITVRYERLPLTDNLFGDYYQDRQFRRHFQQYLNDIWQRKDELLEKLSGQT